MFPESIQKAPFFARGSYRIILYVVLIVWLLPLIGVLLTSFRSLADRICFGGKLYPSFYGDPNDSIFF